MGMGMTPSGLAGHRDHDRGGCAAMRAGHGGDVKWVEWHPWKGLLASASRDASVKLWDPRAGGHGCVSTLHGHKQAVNQVSE